MDYSCGMKWGNYGGETSVRPEYRRRGERGYLSINEQQRWSGVTFLIDKSVNTWSFHRFHPFVQLLYAVFCSQPKASAKSRKPALFSYEKLEAESQLYKNLFGISSAAAKFFGFSFSFFTFFFKKRIKIWNKQIKINIQNKITTYIVIDLFHVDVTMPIQCCPWPTLVCLLFYWKILNFEAFSWAYFSMKWLEIFRLCT